MAFLSDTEPILTMRPLMPLVIQRRAISVHKKYGPFRFKLVTKSKSSAVISMAFLLIELPALLTKQ